MKLYLLKIILFTMIGSSIVFAGGVEEDSGPETISETDQQVADDSMDYDAELTTREDIDEYQEIVASMDESESLACSGEGNIVKWSGGCVTWSGGYIEEDEVPDTFVRHNN